MTTPRHSFLIFILVVLSGCGVTRAPGYDARIHGKIVLPENVDPDTVTATLRYERPRIHFWRLSDRMPRFNGTWQPPYHRRPAAWREIALEVQGNTLAIDEEIEVYRHSHYQPRLDIKGPGMTHIDWAIIFFTNPNLRSGRVDSLVFEDFILDIPGPEQREHLFHIAPATVQLRDAKE